LGAFDHFGGSGGALRGSKGLQMVAAVAHTIGLINFLGV